MSVEAVGWAFRQQLPPKPKILLLTLADQTDERTGKVCYGKTDAAHLAAKSSISKPSFFRYMTALVRNGYARRNSGQAKGQQNEYFLCLDRAPSEIGQWQWGKDLEAEASTDADEPQDIEGADQIDTPSGADHALDGGRITADPAKESFDNQRTSRARDQSQNSFDRSAQDVELARAAPLPPDPDELVVVIEGTRWWGIMQAWWRRTKGRPLNGGYRLEGEYRGRTGRHFKRRDFDAALKTGPPSSSDPLSDESVAAIKKTG
jgi:hypothetical protein